MTSVSKVISTVYPKKSWDAADPAVVEKARIRGERVDRYLSEYVSTGKVEIAAGEWEEVVQRFDICAGWLDRNALLPNVQAQKIVYSAKDGIAGIVDFWAPGGVCDLKNTYGVEHAWKLQLGAYAEYADADWAGILHVAPKVYKEGCRLLKYDAAECRAVWRKAVEWYQTIKMLEGK